MFTSFQNMPFGLPKRSVSAYEIDRFASWNGPFRNAKWYVFATRWESMSYKDKLKYNSLWITFTFCYQHFLLPRAHHKDVDWWKSRHTLTDVTMWVCENVRHYFLFPTAMRSLWNLSNSLPFVPYRFTIHRPKSWYVSRTTMMLLASLRTESA